MSYKVIYTCDFCKNKMDIPEKIMVNDTRTDLCRACFDNVIKLFKERK